MTESYLKNITPDGLTGMAFAMEGVTGSIVLINGPMGCKFYHSSVSESLMMRQRLFMISGETGERIPVNYNYLNSWFFRQERVPCTYLDGYDYVYGTGDKVREALTFLAENIEFDMITVINSPGAALIGDAIRDVIDHELPGRTAIYLESPGYSQDFSFGYSQALLGFLRQLPQRKSENVPDDRPAVNLLGISIWDRYWEGDVEELVRIFDLCGIRVNCVPCAGCSEQEMVHMIDADLNLVLYPERGVEAADYLQAEYGMPCLVLDCPPVGFKATDAMVDQVCRLLNCSGDHYQQECERARALAWKKIDGVYRIYGKPEGVGFAVEADEDLRQAYTTFLTDYLGMIPTEAEEAEIVFGNSNVIASLMTRNRTFCGIEITSPGMGYIDVIRKTHLGIQGALFLIEQVLNGLMSRI